ncbi:hypothetical protein HDA40_002532 [Hamadaea flava]|uniref:Secreted protein n=1 Tax=Hamadaea flava TaxID=1742688 RepID=A0ABV8LL86_9ACTN|nr:hypothetical protein [Hamadaea flava]MCP2324025.1 hypothetical protein [Hamadaea flava]
MTASELAPELARAIDKRSTELVYAYLRTLSEKERKAAFPAVVAYTKEELRDWRGGYAAVAGLAFLGCAPTAKRAMTALNRGSLRWQRRTIPRRMALELLAEREVPWLAELAQLWAQTSRLSDVDEWKLVDALAGAAGAERPQTAGFARGWIGWVNQQNDSYAALTAGDYSGHLLPLLFEDDTMGREWQFSSSGTSFNTALLRLAGDDPSIRTMLVDGCLARLLRGGRPGDLRSFIALYDELNVTPQEIGARVADYAGLADADLGTLATLAQRSLRQADEAGLLEVDTLLDVTAIILRRKEKGLIKTQISWVRKAAKRHPARSTELLASLDLPETLDLLPSTPPIAPTVPQMPAPITTPAEVAEEIAATMSGDRSMVTMERVMAAVVELYGRDRAGLIAAIAPVVEANRHSLRYWTSAFWGAYGEMLVDLLEPPERRSTWLMEAFADLRADHALTRPLSDSERSPSTLLEVRLATIKRYLRRTPVPRLVATPTQTNGHLDPEVLLGRLELAERDGWQPWRADLVQALLRLPRMDPGDGVRARAGRLTSPAGQALARHFRDGHRDPVVTAYAQDGQDGRYSWYGKLPERRMAVMMEPPANADPVEAALFAYPRHQKPQSSPWIPGSGAPLWTGAFPSHREVVAAWALTQLAMSADSANAGGEAAQILPLLAENHGPTGPATQLALVYGMTAPGAADRVAAVDALLGFGAAVDWRATGQHLGDCVAAGSLVLTRAATVLRDTAEAGAIETAWQISVGALPALLALPKPRVGTADLLQLAERCTRTLGRRDQVEGLDTVADRGGSSQFAKAANGLRDALAGVL